MERFIAIIIAAMVVFINFPMNVLAVPTEFSGGVNNEYQYEEYVFLSGEPVKFTGNYKITESSRTDKETINYRFTLTPEGSDVGGKLDRQMTYTTVYTKRDDKGQTIAQTSLTRMRESINIGEDEYELEDFQFSKSDIIDNRPVSDFYTGNFVGRKYYTINDGEGEAIVAINGGNAGYENFWGSTDTQIINYIINVARENEATDMSWQGSVKVQVSDSTTKSLKYSDNEASYSSIQGGHMKVTEREMVSRYDYTLPKMDEGVPVKNKNVSGKRELLKSMVPEVERLIVPKFRDVGGHWAEEDINKLYSLDVFDDNSQFFAPNAPMTRVEFTKGVMRACDIRPNVDEKKRVSSRRNRQPEQSPFADVDINDTDFQYIKGAVDKGIINGVDGEYFKPQNPLTRAEAVVILIRALGFENKAPTPGFATSFDDDRLIPGWAKDAIYVAKEIGLLKGDSGNNVNPGKVLTRAEASALLVRFLQFLESDLQKDYRENIILYN
jgi:hypothetical protein